MGDTDLNFTGGIIKQQLTLGKGTQRQSLRITVNQTKICILVSVHRVLRVITSLSFFLTDMKMNKLYINGVSRTSTT